MTVPEIAEWRGVSILTVRRDRGRWRDWPRPAGSRRLGGRGRPELEYETSAIVELYERRRPSSAKRARWEAARRSSGWRDDDRVDGDEAGARLGVSWHTFRMYPVSYQGTSNPFPPAGD